MNKPQPMIYWLLMVWLSEILDSSQSSGELMYADCSHWLWCNKTGDQWQFLWSPYCYCSPWSLCYIFKDLHSGSCRTSTWCRESLNVATFDFTTYAYKKKRFAGFKSKYTWPKYYNWEAETEGKNQTYVVPLVPTWTLYTNRDTQV